MKADDVLFIVTADDIEEHFIMYRCPFSCSLLRMDTSMTTGKRQTPNKER